MFYYVYILQSKKDNRLYIGFTPDLRTRFKKHRDGKVISTKYRRPLELIYYEAYKNRGVAQKREQQLKTGKAHTVLKKRLLDEKRKVQG